MAESVAGRVWRPTTPEAIEPDLAGLWSEVGREQPVARAVMSNLVVYRTRAGANTSTPDAFEADPLLDDVVARHPSRVIVIEHDPQPRGPCPPFAIAVGVVTFGPPRARYGVEHIAVHSACTETALPSIVRRLLRGDVPTSIWCIDDLSEAPPLDAVTAVGRQLVYDSRKWRDVRRGVLALANRRVDLADMNWRRLTPLRHALIDACRSATLPPLRQSAVRIHHRAGDEALASLACGWLSARLEWTPKTLPQIAPSRNDDDVVSISIKDERTELTATLRDDRVLLVRRGAPPLTIAVPHESAADAVAAELRNLSRDACLFDAVRALIDAFAASP